MEFPSPEKLISIEDIPNYQIIDITDDIFNEISFEIESFQDLQKPVALDPISIPTEQIENRLDGIIDYSIERDKNVRFSFSPFVAKYRRTRRYEKMASFYLLPLENILDMAAYEEIMSMLQSDNSLFQSAYREIEPEYIPSSDPIRYTDNIKGSVYKLALVLRLYINMITAYLEENPFLIGDLEFTQVVFLINTFNSYFYEDKAGAMIDLLNIIDSIEYVLSFLKISKRIENTPNFTYLIVDTYSNISRNTMDGLELFKNQIPKDEIDRIFGELEDLFRKEFRSDILYGYYEPTDAVSFIILLYMTAQKMIQIFNEIVNTIGKVVFSRMIGPAAYKSLKSDLPTFLIELESEGDKLNLLSAATLGFSYLVVSYQLLFLRIKEISKESEIPHVLSKRQLLNLVRVLALHTTQLDSESRNPRRYNRIRFFLDLAKYEYSINIEKKNGEIVKLRAFE